MSYKKTDWVNSVYDDEGNILRKGSPIMAENMNKIENTLEHLFEDTHVHNNKDVLNLILERHINEFHGHTNLEELERITSKQIDDFHNHSNKEIIESIEEKNVHEHGNKEVLDNLTQEQIENSHQHTNKEVLDNITQKHLEDIVNNTQNLETQRIKIDGLVSSLSDLELQVVANIEERDLVENKKSIVHVIDASNDPTVDEGWGQYIWKTDKWVKISEKESLDVILRWKDIVGKPETFTPSTHGHSISQVEGLQEGLDTMETKVGSKLRVENHANDKIKHITPTERTNWDKASDGKHTHSNKDVIDNLEQTVIDNSHKHSNKTVVDKITQEHLNNIASSVTKIGELELSSSQHHTHNNKVVVDKLTQGNLDDIHDHTNKTTLDKVTETTINQTHAHTNKAIIDRISQEDLNKIHEHGNKSDLDKVSYSGVRASVDLVKLDELENHTHKYSDLTGKPNIPNKTSDLENNSNFITGNVPKITVSATPPPSPKANDIWIVL